MASVVKHQTPQLVKDKIIKAQQDEEDFIKILKIIGVKRTTAYGIVNRGSSINCHCICEWWPGIKVQILLSADISNEYVTDVNLADS